MSSRLFGIWQCFRGPSGTGREWVTDPYAFCQAEASRRNPNLSWIGVQTEFRLPESGALSSGTLPQVCRLASPHPPSVILSLVQARTG